MLLHLTSLFAFLLFAGNITAQTSLVDQLQKGIKAYEKKQYAKAERIFDKILQVEEAYADAQLWKGKCLQEFEEYYEAYEHLSTAINLDSEKALYWLEMGKFKYHLGMSSLQKPDLCGSCGKLILPETNQNFKPTDYYKKALLDYKKALELDQQSSEIHFYTALAYEVLGENNTACQHLQIAAEQGHQQSIERSQKNCP